MVDPAKLYLPKELAFYRSKQHERAIVLNSELGTFASIPDCELVGLQALALGAAQLLCSQVTLATLILRRVVYYGLHRPVLDEALPEVPATLYWETTHGCSLRCTYCYMSADTVKPDELTTQEAEELLEGAAALGIKRVVFTGGEALVRKDICQLGLHARRLGLIADLITNGTLIRSKAMAVRLRDSFDNIVTSLDGGCAEDNDVHRGAGSFDQIVRGIRLLNVAGVAPTINSVVSERNVSGLDRLMTFLEHDVRTGEHRVLLASKLGRAHSSSESGERSTYESMHRAIMRRHAFGRSEQVSLSAPHVARKVPQPRKGCGMASGEIYIDSQGFVYPCKLITEKTWCAGNIRNQPLATLLAAPQMQRARNVTIDELDGCKTCAIRRLCGGGCRGRHLGLSGSVTRNDGDVCWALRHGLAVRLWMAEGLPSAALDPSALLLADLRTGLVQNDDLRRSNSATYHFKAVKEAKVVL